MPDRRDLLCWLVERKGYTRYLEIGCETDWTFRAVPCADKVGVDPNAGGTVRATSDAYFASLPHSVKFDLVFVDGDHSAGQVLKDCLNALDHLAEGGTIVTHDCLPTAFEQQVLPGDRHGAYTGDGWRVIASLSRHPILDVSVGAFDWGCGVILPRPNPSGFDGAMPPIYGWSWKQYKEIPGSLFRILPWPALCRWILEGEPARSTVGLSAGSGLTLPYGRSLQQ